MNMETQSVLDIRKRKTCVTDFASCAATTDAAEPSYQSSETMRMQYELLHLFIYMFCLFVTVSYGLLFNERENEREREREREREIGSE